MKKLFMLVATFALLMQVPTVGQANDLHHDRAHNRGHSSDRWDELGKIADKLEEAYDDFEDRAGQCGDTTLALAMQGHELAVRLDRMLSGSHGRWARSDNRLQEVYFSLTKSFLSLRIRVSRSACNHEDFAEIHHLMVRFDVFFRSMFGKSGLGCALDDHDDKYDHGDKYDNDDKYHDGDDVNFDDDTDEPKKGEQGKPINEKPVDQEPVDQKPIDQKPIDQKPVDQKPVDQKPVDQKPIDQKPIDQKPIDQKPIDQKPIDQKPIDQKPVDQKPIDQHPVDQKPVDQIGHDMAELCRI
jgi:hypothetical protein